MKKQERLRKKFFILEINLNKCLGYREINCMYSKKSTLVLCILSALFSIPAVAEMPLVSAMKAGYDAEKLAEADAELKALYYDGLIPNYVVAAAKDGEIFYTASLGTMRIGSGSNVDIDTRYQVALSLIHI